MPLHQYDYILAIGTIFAFLDAWNIGANDVANSWANSVASRSVTYIQAMCIASVMEFAGATAVGSRVADTIRTKIVDTNLYRDDPAILMLGMVCAVVGSSCFLTFATKIGLPISTTHSILGGVLGMGIATVGSQGILWIGKGGGTDVITGGIVQVFMAWIIAPVLAGIIAAILFVVIKHLVLLRRDPVMRGLLLVPVYSAITAMLITMLLVWKGGSYTVTISDSAIPAVIVGVGVLFGILIALTLVPWAYRFLVKEDWELRWFDLIKGPLLLKRGEVRPMPPTYRGVIYQLKRSQATTNAAGPGLTEAGASVEVAASPTEANISSGNEVGVAMPASAARGKEVDMSAAEKGLIVDAATPAEEDDTPPRKALVGPKPEGLPWHNRAMLLWYLKFALFHGVDQDVVGSQSEKSALAGDVSDMHARTRRYDAKAEYLFIVPQVITNAAASFTHGANDVSNAIGPYSAVFQIWKDGRIADDGKSGVPIWILFFGGSAIVIGLWTFGYNVMRNLGNRLTLQTPTRGFTISLSSAATIILATRLKLPVSTTQCITGATVGVGLCNGEWKAVNWRMVAWIYMGWFITLPATGLISGCLMGLIINAPRWGMGQA